MSVGEKRQRHHWFARDGGDMGSNFDVNHSVYNNHEKTGIFYKEKGIVRKYFEANSRFFDSIESKLSEMEDDYEQMRDRLEDQIEQTDNPVVEQRLKRTLDELDGAMRKMKHEAPSPQISNDRFKEVWNNYMGDVRDALGEAANSLQRSRSSSTSGTNSSDGANASGSTGAPSSPSVIYESPELAAPPTLSSSDSSTASNSSAPSTTAGSGDLPETDQMLEMIRNDPQAAADKLEGLDSKQQQMLMMSVQQRMQEINRMFSMMTNITKSMHDTQKAIINNLRV